MAAIDRWNELTQKWNSLLEQATVYQDAMDAKMVAFLTGQGAHPTESEYQVGLELWEKESQARNVLLDFIADNMGQVN